MLGVPGPLVHPGLRTRSRESVDSRYSDALSSLQSSWGSRNAKDSKGLEGVDETDADDELVASAVDHVGCSLGDFLASPETRTRRCDRSQLCGLSSSWGTGNATSEEPGGTYQTRKCRSDVTFLSGDSGGRKRSLEQKRKLSTTR